MSNNYHPSQYNQCLHPFKSKYQSIPALNTIERKLHAINQLALLHFFHQLKAVKDIAGRYITHVEVFMRQIDHQQPLFSVAEYEAYDMFSSQQPSSSLLLYISQRKQKQRQQSLEEKTIPYDKTCVEFARAFCPFEAEYDNEISLHKNEVVAILSKRNKDWWKGRLRNGNIGYFPANHVKMINKTAKNA